MTRKVTIEDIAVRARVSKYSVSKALSGQDGVSEQTRERIVSVAADLGYLEQRHIQGKYKRSSSPAAANSGKRSVMVLMPDIRMQNLDSYYWGRIMDGIADELKKDHLFMIIATEYSVEGWSSLLNVKELLGVIIVGMISTPMLLEVSKMNLPVVMVDHEDALFLCDTLFVDNFDGTSRIVSHLLTMGHTRLQFIGDVHFSRSFQERWLGFRATLEEHGLAIEQDERLLHVYSLVMDKIRIELQDILMDLINRDALPTGLVCANDEIAIGAMEALRTLGVAVPERVSVTGFDNVDKSEYVTPALTTMNVVKEELGRRSVEMMLRRHRNPSAMLEKVLLLTELVHRQSVAQAPVSSH